MSARRTTNKQEKGVYNIHGVTNSQYSINGVGFGSNDFMLTRKESVIDTAKKINPWFKQKCKKVFRKKTFLKRLPILQWLPKYNLDDFIGDLIAGVTVGLTVIPQALAYAGIAGLPAQAGLYGSYAGCLLYIFIGSCRCVSVGPSSTSSFLTGQVAGGNWPRAIVCGVIAGFVELLMGLFGLGFIIDFVSGPVLSGFSSAVAIMIFTGQIKSFLGIHAKGFTFIQVWRTIIADIHNTRIGDTIMGVCCMTTLLLMRQMPHLKFGPKDDNQKKIWQKVVNKIIWIIGTARNFLVVVTATIISYNLIENGQGHWLKTIGNVPSGMPEFKIPDFSSQDVKNATGFVIQKGETFWEMISYMNIGLLAVPLIALIETMSINKSGANGKSLDPTQELIAIGAGQLVNSLVGAYPGNGSFSRGAINKASGARTPLGSLYSGVLVIIALLYFTPYFQYIPDAALAAVIMAAVIFMVEYAVVKPLWRSKRSDLIPGLTTFICCLSFGIPLGTFIGIGVNIIFVLYHSARPKIQVDKRITSGLHTKFLFITPDRCLMFPSVEYVRNLINKEALRNATPVVIDCTHIYGADYTAAMAIQMLLNDFASRNQPIFFLNLKPSVAETFEEAELDFHLFYSYHLMEQAIDDSKVLEVSTKL